MTGGGMGEKMLGAVTFSYVEPDEPRDENRQVELTYERFGHYKHLRDVRVRRDVPVA